MAYIQQRGERKYKITVCNGYKPNGQKRMQARTVDVPKEVPKRSIRQYVMAEAERLEKRFRTGIDQSENSRFEDYANGWLTRMERRYKASTLEGYRRMLEAVYSSTKAAGRPPSRPVRRLWRRGSTRWSSAAKRPAVRPFWPATGTWWTAPPAVSPGAPAPPVAPPTPCATRRSKACGCGMWPSLANGRDCAL